MRACMHAFDCVSCSFVGIRLVSENAGWEEPPGPCIYRPAQAIATTYQRQLRDCPVTVTVTRLGKLSRAH